jgi:membrane-associated phospholipid phosphatase
MSRTRLTVIALVSLLATALLSLAVSRGHSADGLEQHAVRVLLHAPAVDRWGKFADFLATPVIGAVVLVCLVFGALRRVLLRVVAGAAFATIAFEVNERVVKPLVHERFRGALSFPSGHVTAVCATALAMWIALYPVLGRSARVITFAIGAAWTILMSVAVVGAFWHTPLDDIGSVLLSVGFVTAGAAILLPKQSTPAPPVEAEPEPEPELVTAGV